MMLKQFLLSFFLLLAVGSVHAQIFKQVPAQKLPLFKMIDSYYYKVATFKNTTDSISLFEIPEFEISNFITYSEYKKYLSIIKKDSSIAYYRSQLPDSNISKDINVYLEYLNSSKYDKYPVLGISWNNAMNYCSWRNQIENISDTAYGAYRLPNTSEWISAFVYFQTNSITNDMNKKYTDWLLANYFEGSYNLSNFGLDTVFPVKKDERPVYHRKRLIGNSFLYDQQVLLEMSGYGYDYTGYRYVGFRMVKGKSINTFNRY